jgi:hypothetical protein
MNRKTQKYEFRVCKSVHHHTFNLINQPDAANSQVYYLSFKYSSTCFGHPHAHHQELQQLQQQPLVYCWSLVIAVLLVVVRSAGPTSFGHPHAHHQELKQVQQQPLVYRRSLVIAVLLVVDGPTTTNSTAITKLRR